MAEHHRIAGQKAHGEILCDKCRGTGRLSAPSRSSAGRAGGNQNIINARRGIKKNGEPALSMSERSRMATRHTLPRPEGF